MLFMVKSIFPGKEYGVKYINWFGKEGSIISGAPGEVLASSPDLDINFFTSYCIISPSNLVFYHFSQAFGPIEMRRIK